jgi:hypothetical protein
MPALRAVTIRTVAVTNEATASGPPAAHIDTYFNLRWLVYARNAAAV